MISKENIKEVISHCNELGLQARVRDVAFAVLSRAFDDEATAYQCLFGSTDGMEQYLASKLRCEVEEYMELRRLIPQQDDTGVGITFTENRKEMEALLVKTQSALDEGLIEPKDGLKILADIRVKLNDKFNIQSEKQDRVIIVNSKYNDVCDYCHHEIRVPTKEELMIKYNLIEKK